MSAPLTPHYAIMPCCPRNEDTTPRTTIYSYRECDRFPSRERPLNRLRSQADILSHENLEKTSKAKGSIWTERNFRDQAASGSRIFIAKGYPNQPGTVLGCCGHKSTDKPTGLLLLKKKDTSGLIATHLHLMTAFRADHLRPRFGLCFYYCSLPT